MKLAALFLPLVVLLACTALANDRPSDLESFPAAKPGYIRSVVRLPALPDEVNHKVEILAGKILRTDCNTTWLGGDLKRQVVEGWGYSYHVLDKVSMPVSTMMACPPE